MKKAMVHVNLRIPEEVLKFYKKYPNYTGKMRQTLVDNFKKVVILKG